MPGSIKWVGEKYWDIASEDGLFRIVEDDGGEVNLSLFGLGVRPFGSIKNAKVAAERLKSDLDGYYKVNSNNRPE